MARITAQLVQVATQSRDQVGALIFVDGALVALFVRLADTVHEEDCGRWYLEAGFGDISTKAELFETIRHALAWVADRTSGTQDQDHLDDLADTIELGLPSV